MTHHRIGGIISVETKTNGIAERTVWRMYETVKVVNGYEIYRMKGTHGAYHVDIRVGKGWKEYQTFKTIKAAIAFCKSL